MSSLVKKSVSIGLRIVRRMSLAGLVALSAFTGLRAQTLDRSHEHAVLLVEGEPFIMLAGELHNSTTSDVNLLGGVWDKLEGMHLNTVLAAVSWELVEPVEGQFDFTHVDAIISGARQHGMKVALLWFGTFKNPFMTYAPSWVKVDQKRFPHSQDADGTYLELPSLWDDRIIEADKKAYVATLRHIKETDNGRTVIAVQVGNEPGLQTSTRDCSPAANRAWESDVPSEVIKYMREHKGNMQPDIDAAWRDNGYKSKGNWEAVFGKSITADDGSNPILHLTEHLFTAYSFAHYIEELAYAGKQVLNVPTFVNATGAVGARGRSMGNGCSIPDFLDIYMAAAPSLDIYAPNCYATNIDEVCAAFAYNGNPVMVPESNRSAVRPFYLIGEWDALCFAPFAIEDQDYGTDFGRQLGDTYRLLANMRSLISGNLNSHKMRGVFLNNRNPRREIVMGNYTIHFTPDNPNEIMMAMMVALGGIEQIDTFESAEEKKVFESAALVIQTDADEFILAGSGVNATFTYNGDKTRFCDFDTIREGTFDELGQFIPGRLLNGDERQAWLPHEKAGVLKVKMYHF